MALCVGQLAQRDFTDFGRRKRGLSLVVLATEFNAKQKTSEAIATALATQLAAATQEQRSITPSSPARLAARLPGRIAKVERLLFGWCLLPILQSNLRRVAKKCRSPRPLAPRSCWATGLDTAESLTTPPTRQATPRRSK